MRGDQLFAGGGVLPGAPGFAAGAAAGAFAPGAAAGAFAPGAPLAAAPGTAAGAAAPAAALVTAAATGLDLLAAADRDLVLAHRRHELAAGRHHELLRQHDAVRLELADRHLDRVRDLVGEAAHGDVRDQVVEHAALGMADELELHDRVGLHVAAHALELDVQDPVAERVPLQLAHHRRLERAAHVDLVQVRVMPARGQEVVLVDVEMEVRGRAVGFEAGQGAALGAQLARVARADLVAFLGLEDFALAHG